MADLIIIGTGFVGGVTGAVLAEQGLHVTCVDIDANKIKAYESGHMPFYEKGLKKLVRNNIAANRLKFTTNIRQALDGSHLVMIAVPTPDAGDGSPNLSYVLGAAEEVMQYARRDKPIALIIKSTVPANCFAQIDARLIDKRGQYVLVSNPEFLREGSAVEDTLHPDRIIVGCTNLAMGQEVLNLYATLDESVPRLLLETPQDAMLIKHGANALLANKVSFINNMAQVCERLGGDIVNVAKGIGLDRRIGRQFLDASIGYGGACFPKDVKALAYTAASVGASTTIFDAIARMNEEQLDHAANLITSMVSPGATVAVFGLSFKAGTSDTRFSPAVTIIDKLKEQYRVVATDPVALEYDAAQNVRGIQLTENLWDAAKGADCAAFLTEWDEYRNIDLAKLASVMQTRNLFDGRCLFDPKQVRAAGFTFRGIGRGV